jgi:hypothetical protein
MHDIIDVITNGLDYLPAVVSNRGYIKFPGFFKLKDIFKSQQLQILFLELAYFLILVLKQRVLQISFFSHSELHNFFIIWILILS